MAQLLNHNGVLIPDDEFVINPSNRALSFGDGFFESCLFQNGTCKLWEFHVERIEKGFKLLGFENDNLLPSLLSQVNDLLHQNGEAISRVKITFYRAGSGVYSPETNEAHFLITSKSIDRRLLEKKGLISGFSSKTYVNSNSLGIKTLSALNYVLAAKEKQRRNLDELILSNERGELAETVSSNIWWYMNEKFYTPAPSTGCVEGVYKAYLKKVIMQEGMQIVEGVFDKSTLLKADEIFISNAVQGICWIDAIDDVFFKNRMVHYLIDKVKLES